MVAKKNLTEQIFHMTGIDAKKCMMCGKCTASCPAFDVMEYHPHQFAMLIGQGRAADLINSKGIWSCLSCMACADRCPRGVEPARLIEAVRVLSQRQQGMDHMKPEQVPKLLDEELPQQAIASAFRKYRK